MSDVTGTSSGTPSPGVPVTGLLVENTLLFMTGEATTDDMTDAVEDCLLYAAHPAPTPASITTWFPAYVKMLTSLGWLTTGSSTTTHELGSSRPARVAPWTVIRKSITPPYGSGTAAALDGLVAELPRLPSDAAAYWDTRTAVGVGAVMVAAVGAAAAGFCTLELSAAWLTYPASATASPPHAYPATPVPVRGATVTIPGVTLQISAAALLILKAELDPRVVEAKKKVAAITVST